MIYSCFNDKAGHYEYFEDDRGHAMNGDLPVPDLRGKIAGRVGVPAQDAGRKLPSGVRRAGHGWQARGMIVRCGNQPMRGLSGGDDARYTGLKTGLVFVGGGLAIYGLFRIYMDAMQEWGR